MQRDKLGQFLMEQPSEFVQCEALLYRKNAFKFSYFRKVKSCLKENYKKFAFQM
jgi:hypothetical protein